MKPQRWVGAVLAIAVAVFGVPVAGAVPPPVVDPGAAPLPGLPAHPPEEAVQRSQCAKPVLTGGLPKTAPRAQRILDLPSAWKFSTGAGQTVAVIDTGVNQHPRLPALIPGGDYVSGTDGTLDCDGHGTLVAGLIAAQPSPDDAFSGVAPDAAILAIRQLSLEYEAKDYNNRQGPVTMSSGGFGNVFTLALAVERAVDLHASVINISEVACAAAGTDLGDGALGAAVEYAYEHDVVVVAAAGNVQQDGACKTQNDGTGWDAVRTVASPAWFSPYVLSVASTDDNGEPSSFSLDGPWVSVAAPGTNLYSLDSTPGGTGLVNGIAAADGATNGINGTSFASAYVAGVVALVRSRFPNLSAAQVMERVVRTAHAPGPGRDDRLGYGIVDPVAALTAQIPDLSAADGASRARAVAPPQVARPVDPLPRRIALIVAIACAVALAAGAALAVAFRGRRHRRLTEGVDY
ncbi:type VII secretion-associated serine protease mycosin [Nocardia sp. NPDC005998]|uniref:type VII secretion-associated serine protease mycosin n=1 Tax=Nocardia sp. NPDC005998 TaxID=3156894 RepID=UPI0033A88A53